MVLKNILIKAGLLFSLLLVTNLVSAQSNNCTVHLDKSFYVTGEVIWYKIYLPGNLKDKNFTIQVKIANNQGSIVENYFLKTEGKTFADGYYKIPFNISSGVYQFIFSGQDTKVGKESRLAQIKIPIYNDLEAKALPAKAPATPAAAPAPRIEDLQVAIELEKDAFQNRDEIKAIIRLKDKNGQPIKGNFSVAVKDWDLAGDKVLNHGAVWQGGNLPSSITYYPDSTMYKKGQIFNEKDKAIQANLLGIYSPENNRMSYANSGENGNFHIKVDPFYGQKSIQVVAYQKEHEFIKVKMNGDQNFGETEPLIYPEGIRNYLKHSRERKKIFQLYSSIESNIEPAIVTHDFVEFKADRSFLLEQYENFENVATFFTEVLTNLKLKANRKGVYKAQMANPVNSWDYYYPGKPIFIVDGKVTLDGDFVAKMDLKKVKEILLFYELKTMRKYFGAFGTDGIVVVNTHNGNMSVPADDEANVFSVKGFQPSAEFPSFHPDQIGNKRNQPFFRPQLHWEPNLETDENGEATLTFYQSDDLGTFQIEVVGQGENGAMGYGEVKYVSKR